MKKIAVILLFVLLGAFVLVSCGSPAEEPTAVPEPVVEEPEGEPTDEPIDEPTDEPMDEPAAEEHAVHWGYEGEGAPENWADLNPDYALCGTGMEQSPINIPADAPVNAADLVFDYEATAVNILHNGHAIQVNYDAGSSVQIDGQTYNLLQIHFHGSSEHTLGGANTAMEMHLVHQNADGGLAVVGVMIEDGAENPASMPVWDNLPTEESEAETIAGATISVNDLMPTERSYYRYDGSLTTPPCSEGVKWHVLDHPVELSGAQIAAFTDIVGSNNRPVQPMNEREFITAMAELRTDGLEGETITFYHFGDLSGPYAAITGPLIHGMEDAVNAINDAGGIRGAAVEIQFADTGGSVEEAVATYDRFTGADDNILMVITYGSGEVEALASRFAEDQIPSLSAGLSAAGFYGPDSGYVFGLGPIYPDQFGAFLDWATANWADVKPASAGDEIKLAYLSWPGAFGQGALSDEAVAYAESLGVEIVANEQYDLSPTADTTTAILNAQAAGANVIWTNTLAFGPAALMNGLGALGLQSEFLLAGDNWAMDLATYAFVSDPALAVGLVSPFPYLWWNDADHPGVQYAEGLFAANERGAGEHNVGYLLLVAGVDVAVQAIEKAIDEVGFDAMTGADVHRALTEMGPYEGLEGVIQLDYSNGSRSPHVTQIRQIQGGPDAFNVLQDWTETPDLRPE